MKIEELLDRIKNPDDIPDVKKAYEFALNNLKDKKRKNGDYQICHCLEVANILINLNVDNTTIVSALLHDVLDYSDILPDTIKNEFGEEVYTIVTSVTKINSLELIDDSENSAMYLRKVLVGMCEDVRVLFIKLADRLHNMRTMQGFSKEHQKKVANETLSVLVPIAHRLGINYIKSELENWCLYYLKPDVYNDILEKLNSTVDELNDYLIQMKESICNLLNENEIKYEIKGRVKSVYSIYNKLNNGKKWSDIYDILALRIFVTTESECYTVMGILHSKFRPMQSRFKDYIAVPKENMYQSLHTTVFGEGGKLYEIQIRTYEMDEIAEKGIASHWSYKEKGTKKIQTMMEQKLELYRNIIESNDAIEDSEFADIIDSDILSDVIYVFTPKGDVIELPKGSTPVDFAYRIHSKVGDKMVGAIVNDNMASLDTVLCDNDVVKIMTNPNAKPNKDWLKIAKTTQAKNKIKAYFSKLDKNEYIAKGKDILEKDIRKRKLSFNDVLSNENMEKICDEFNVKDLDDLYLSIGSFRNSANSVINFAIGYVEPSDSKKVTMEIKNKSDILVDDKASILTHLAKCCNPIKGDKIVGYITKNDGIAVHREGCSNIGPFDRCVDVRWNESVNNNYVSSLYIILSMDKPNLSDLIATLTLENVFIISFENVKDSEYRLNIRVKDVDNLNSVINRITKLAYVRSVKRI